MSPALSFRPEAEGAEALDQVAGKPAVPHGSEGREVTLGCSYDQTAYNLFWYIQKPGQTIKLLLSSYFKDADLDVEFRGRVHFSSDTTNRRFPLNITNIRMSDTAMYYCVFTATLC
ncbi:hypothetical protein GDO78_013819 [Eleutherodactylus coqui]|uniref:Ig-like domain-containing protein n=1 Tax=Eleutherodactylus coqui TaxID=57060 RepID=A0A8J6EFC6_ELECQ|nr:hypothetical protein GDO78_013819 [Eleutherodactylus coqui]